MCSQICSNSDIFAVFMFFWDIYLPVYGHDLDQGHFWDRNLSLLNDNYPLVLSLFEYLLGFFLYVGDLEAETDNFATIRC